MESTYPSSGSNSSSMNSLRPLLPRAEGSHGPNPSDLSTGKRRKASNACTECRSHKTKCDQGVPACSACRRRGAGECIYIPGNDGRRRDPVERLRRDNDMMKLVLQAIRSSPADEANSIVESIRSDYSLEDLVSLIQNRGGELSEASPSSFTSTSNSAGADVDSPPRRPITMHSPESHGYNNHMERQSHYGEPDLELPPITNHHHGHHHHHDHRRYHSAQGTKLPVFEASAGGHPLDDREYRRFPPTL
ncbi:hypothetical protein TWF694_007179 [Orbilia ellipsospora]|uniref:Zn(2)-C6 fungal-type domain-containing protein n=1 Tax=Orbilia ellipsospora TaxID=2528407 RepID=A0AAV9XHE2_9PEZI